MEVEKAYLAGLYDGEGYIGIIKITDRRIKKWTKLGYYFRPTLKLGLTEPSILKKIKEKYGGCFSSFLPTGTEIGKKCYTLTLNCQGKIIKELEDILPYLKVKKKQAELLLEYCISRYEKVQKDPAHKKCSFSKKEIEIYEKLRKLNRKGK